MSSRRRIVAEDAFSRVWEVDQDTPVSEYDDFWPDRVFGVEQQLRDIATFWQTKAASYPRATGRRLSFGDYAKRITSVVARLRGIVAAHPEHEGSILLGIALGQLTTEAQWRFNVGPTAIFGRQQRTKTRQAGLTSGRLRRLNVRNRVDDIRRLWREIRQQHPYDRHTASTRWLATRIARRLKPKLAAETVRKQLTELGLQ